MIKQNKRLFTIILSTALLLLIPFISMQFTEEVNWSLSDFVIAWFLLLGTGIAAEILLRKIKDRTLRIVLLLFLFIGLLLIWAELAVGIFGTPLAGQ